MSNNGTQLRIRGKVQGVGFRPWVWQLAQRLGLKGDVCNDGAGVVVRLVGETQDFITQLAAGCPPLARIDEVRTQPWHWAQPPLDFTIRASAHGQMSTQVVPDAATCPACLAEMNDPRERRYRYPFINCTHCGPRFTIIRAMPYDRPATTMAEFALCPACEAEYRNPADRRFHAQPVACPDCGPQLSWVSGEAQEQKDPALQAAVAMLKSGGIVAIKGLGGFHLAVDASNAQAVNRLRERKRRPTKPLAVMIPARLAASLPAATQALLRATAAPIVLVDKRIFSFCEAIAPGLNEVGVMLAANPLQHLLMQDLDCPLVMTSGNLNGCPPALTNDKARQDLAGIADGWLLHNRDIVQRMDDSVQRASGEMLRRSRGFVPDALPLPPGFAHAPSLLCLGADLKNTFCLVRGGQAVLSQHLGDLGDDEALAQWQQALSALMDLWQFTPEGVVTDAHPGYRSTRLGEQMPYPQHQVLHHHAHAAACLAEHGWPRDGGEVIALVLDGIGQGDNGELWGGECLRVSYSHCEKLGGLPAVALPGGDLAARQPWRNLLAQWQAFVPNWQSLPEATLLADKPWPPLAQAIARGVNAPLASSAGRLFDAVAAATGCAPAQLSYEGEAACRLEALALNTAPVSHPLSLTIVNDQLDMATFWQQWLGWQATDAERAWAFHDALAHGLATLAARHARQRGLTTIVCSGGVLHNRLLRQRLQVWLRDFNVLFPARLPAGDGAIAFGQAVIAAATLS
ncbi:carbamoyltransferase HypF [Enterobacteriaceae bacterium H4N4]|uniref:Carbamoyltransferase HypF n=1 Tax=Silvania confinis TaxID=2926470 RepID=A0A9J6QCY4_9ENTR|nr:carbamoyltransferase HypF [Silvania confinis]MCU6668817.1 carbamoyltransferase HypF [Silvania confinis]